MGTVTWIADYEVSPLALARKQAVASKANRKKRQKPLTAAEMQDAKLLRDAWERVAHERSISNKALAAEWGVHPSNVSQYLYGHIALNIEAKLRFSYYLSIAPQRIWPDFPFPWISPSGLPPDALSIAIHYTEVTDEMKPHAKAMLEALPRKSTK